MTVLTGLTFSFPRSKPRAKPALFSNIGWVPPSVLFKFHPGWWMKTRFVNRTTLHQLAIIIRGWFIQIHLELMCLMERIQTILISGLSCSFKAIRSFGFLLIQMFSTVWKLNVPAPFPLVRLQPYKLIWPLTYLLQVMMPFIASPLTHHCYQNVNGLLAIKFPMFLLQLQASLTHP